MHLATTDIYTLSLHDALPIFSIALMRVAISGSPTRPRRFSFNWRMTSIESRCVRASIDVIRQLNEKRLDRKSTRLNSSHLGISYAVFCLKKKKHKGDKQDAH